MRSGNNLISEFLYSQTRLVPEEEQGAGECGSGHVLVDACRQEERPEVVDGGKARVQGQEGECQPRQVRYTFEDAGVARKDNGAEARRLVGIAWETQGPGTWAVCIGKVEGRRFQVFDGSKTKKRERVGSAGAGHL